MVSNSFDLKALVEVEETNKSGLVWLFNGISTFVGYLMPMLFFKKNSSGTI